jgi:acyl-CoA hydrolase/RimJ/RimL family protein N-acetyltransferase
MSPKDWKVEYQHKLRDPKSALRNIRPGERIFIGSGCAVPSRLIQGMEKIANRLADTEIMHILTVGDTPYTNKQFCNNFRCNSFFIGKNTRAAIAEGRADYTPVFLSDLPHLFKNSSIPIDIALIQVTPPDDHGFCSFGVSVDVVKSAAESAKTVIAEINPQMPRTLGDSLIAIDSIDILVENDTPIPEMPLPPSDEIAERIAKNISGLIEDGATIQMGIGTIPTAIVRFLNNKKDLGVHSEMISDGVVDLWKEGIITNKKKSIHQRKIITTFCMGTKKLYDFVNNNPFVEFYPSEYVNNPYIISLNEKMVAINSALEVDLTGQVSAESMGYFFYSGIGGQADFMRGASKSKGGKPIIALPSTAKHETISRIVPHLSEAAGVVTSRGDVHYVVTEYGVAYLHGKSIRERAIALINIAHPKFRQKLLNFSKIRCYVYADQVLPKTGRPYPEELEIKKCFDQDTEVFFRPVKQTDEHLMKEFFYSFSDESFYQRFFTHQVLMPHSRLQHLVNPDYDEEMAITGLVQDEDREQIIAVGRYYLDRSSNLAEIAFMVHEHYHNKQIGTFLLQYLIQIAKNRGISGFKAAVLAENKIMMRVIHKCGYHLQSKLEDDCYSILIKFNE